MDRKAFEQKYHTLLDEIAHRIVNDKDNVVTAIQQSGLPANRMMSPEAISNLISQNIFTNKKLRGSLSKYLVFENMKEAAGKDGKTYSGEGESASQAMGLVNNIISLASASKKAQQAKTDLAAKVEQAKVMAAEQAKKDAEAKKKNSKKTIWLITGIAAGVIVLGLIGTLVYRSYKAKKMCCGGNVDDAPVEPAPTPAPTPSPISNEPINEPVV